MSGANAPKYSSKPPNAAGRRRPWRVDFRELFTRSVVPQVLFDADSWQAIDFSDSAAHYMGYEPDAFAGVSITDLELTPNPSETADHVARILEVGHDVFEQVHKTKGGTPRRVLIHCRAAGLGDGSRMLHTTWRDAWPAGGSARRPAFRHNIIYRSSAMAHVLTLAERVARSDATALIVGETGTGKELVARAIHGQSARHAGPLVTVNCGALPAELIESELFGHERGAFTGASRQRAGAFEQANGGTLFLDEIGELPAAAQVAILRALQEREIRRVGGSRQHKVDVRVVAATHRDLAAMVKSGEFREDLFYRLSVVPIVVPPLRQRPEDIPVLVQHFLEQTARRLGVAPPVLAEPTRAALLAHPWPGNVRELQNAIERLVVLGDGRVEVCHLPEPLCSAPPPDALDGVIVAHIRSTLDATGWVIEGPGGAATRLGLKPSTLRNKMRRLGIRRNRR